MKYIITILIVFGLSGSASVYCQDKPIKSKSEIQPEFPGGLNGLYTFIQENFKVPSNDSVILTRVFFSVNIDSSGVASLDSIIDLSRGANYKDVEQELLRFIALMPRWKAGIRCGVKVPMKMTIPLRIEMH